MRTKKKLNHKLPVVDKVVLIINIFAVLALLLSYLAPSTDPRDFWIIAVFGLAYQVILLVNILFVLYWTIRLKWFVFISTICIVIGFNAIIANFGFHKMTQKEIKESPEDIRIMLYNVRQFIGLGIKENEPDQRDILKLINDKQPDIVSLIEYTSKPSDRGSISDSLKKLLNTKYAFSQLHKNKNGDSTGIAIFSKYPIINSGSIPETRFLKVENVFVDVKHNNKIFRVYSIHLLGVHFKKEKTSVSHGKVHLNESTLVLDKLKIAFIKRSYQTAIIKRHLNNCKYPYVILGDLDDTPLSFTVNELTYGLKNAFIERGTGFVTTYYNKFPKLQIDYILTSPEFDVLNYQALDKKISDHKPIISDVKLN
ncbi:MAG: hypothetical protein JWR05_2206 [Mucilaginibacter sp.]|nr:hypothetical protein [Mucilaginibacter sp.]